MWLETSLDMSMQCARSAGKTILDELQLQYTCEESGLVGRHRCRITILVTSLQICRGSGDLLHFLATE